MDPLQDIQEININNDHILIEIPPIESCTEAEEKAEEENLEGIAMEDEDIIEELEIVKLEDTSTKIKSKKRVSLTIEKKIEIIQRHEKGESQKSLSVEFNVGRTTISDIIKRKYKFFKVKLTSKARKSLFKTLSFLAVHLNEF